MKTPKLHHPYHVNYLQGFWLDLAHDILKAARTQAFPRLSRLFKGRHLRLRWEHVVISFLLGLLMMQHGSVRVLKLSQPAPAMMQLKTLPQLKEASYKPLDVLQPIWVSKLRPPDTYPNGYAPGNCTAGVASRLSIPDNWGNANNWSYAASIAGYTVTNTPTVESIAQTSGDSWAGHVAIVLSVNPDGSFLIWEENYNGLYSTDTRLTTTAEFPNFIIP